MTMTTKTTTDSSFGSKWWRSRIVGVATALLLTMAACSNGAEAEIATTTTGDNVTTTTAATVTPTTAAPDPAALLADALGQYSAGYEFTATITVNDQATTVQTGRWLNGSSQLMISSGDGEVEYIVTGGGQWSRLPDAEWAEVEGSPATAASPLAAMGTPDSLELVSSDGGITVVRAVYPAAALGIDGEPVVTSLSFENGALTQVAFEAEISGVAARSVTTLAPLSDTSPIVAPQTS